MKRSGFQYKESWKPLQRGGPMPRSCKRINPIGPKTRTWMNVRKDIKQRFEWAGITICEFRFQGCYYDSSGGFAHCKKRRKLLEGEIWHVALSCLHCHTILDEKMSHEEMHAAVHAIIDNRGLIAPPAILQQVQKQADGS